MGKGTEDVMIFQQGTRIENSIQIVSPSTAQILAKKINQINKRPILIKGELMAGEPWHKEVYKLCAEAPESVIMTNSTARSLRYVLDQVRSKGVKIVEDDEIDLYEGSVLEISDINWKRIEIGRAHV